MPKIADILNAAFRTGETNGKPWSLMSIRTDDNKEATIFAPAAVGDEVELTFNDKYQNYSAKKPGKSLNAALNGGQLNQINEKLDRILNLLETQDKQNSRIRAIADEQPAADLPPVSNYDEGTPF